MTVGRPKALRQHESSKLQTEMSISVYSLLLHRFPLYNMFTTLAPKMLIRARTPSAVDSKASPTLYSCRPNKSTAHAAFLIKRLQDWSEQKGCELHPAPSDWLKAFDTAQHSKLLHVSATLSSQLRTTEECTANTHTSYRTSTLGSILPTTRTI